MTRKNEFYEDWAQELEEEANKQDLNPPDEEDWRELWARGLNPREAIEKYATEKD